MPDLGYRCSLLFKALFGEDEKKQARERFEKELYEAHGKAIEEFREIRLKVEFKRADQILLERFEEWLREQGYSENYVRKIVYAIKQVFKEIGFPTIEKMDSKYRHRPSTSKIHLYSAFNRFRDFLASRSSFTEGGKEEVEECGLLK